MCPAIRLMGWGALGRILGGRGWECREEGMGQAIVENHFCLILTAYAKIPNCLALRTSGHFLYFWPYSTGFLGLFVVFSRSGCGKSKPNTKNIFKESMSEVKRPRIMVEP